jgi:hypothetical protein
VRKIALQPVLLLVALLAVSAPLLAHHGNAQYMDKKLTLKGTVTDWRWTNPHVFLKMDVKDDDGKVENWTCELVAPSNMVNFGFTADSFKPGDQVTVITSQIAKNGTLVARLGYDPKAGLIRGWDAAK